MTTVLDRYHRDLESGRIKHDAQQADAIRLLQSIADQIGDGHQPVKKMRFGLFKDKRHFIKGMYIHGPVGRGKSYVMDLFYEALQTSKKKRLHFHEFMISVHDFVHTQRLNNQDLDKALPRFVEDMAQQTQVLCFDEFHVTDVADAMILGRLFTLMNEAGVVTVLTTNWAPDDLYKNGIQRDRFLPVIDAIKDKMTVIRLDGGCDYRQDKIKDKSHFLWPDDTFAAQEMDTIFDALSSGRQVEPMILKVKGHDLIIPHGVDGLVARFDYADLIAKDYGAEDFLTLAKHFQTILIEHLRPFSPDNTNEAKRFMTVVDTFYDQRALVVISSAVAMDKLYEKGPLHFEFARCLSRLREMQSSDYRSGVKKEAV